MLLRNLGSDESGGGMWQQLSDGVPTVAGFAGLCSRFLAGMIEPPSELCDEANAILVAARDRGVLEIRVSKEAFDSLERFVAVCVEKSPDRRLIFKQKSNPRQTLKFIEGFRQLCQAGLVMHHAQKDFSLTVAGFEAAEKLSQEDYRKLLDFAEEVTH